MKILPTISICIPCFNAKKYIAKTLRSALAQTYQNFVIHVVDNHSTDNTLKIVKEFRDKRIKIHTFKKNIGMFGNMNRCLKLAKTPYIKILCADDIIHPDCIRQHVSVLEQYPNVALVYNASTVINDDDKVIFSRKFLKKNRIINGGVLVNKILKTGRNPVGEPSGITFRRQIITKYKLSFNLNFRYISDLEIWIKILKYGNGYYIDETLSSFRIHKGSGTTRVIEHAIKEHLGLISLYSGEFDLSFVDIMIISYRLLFYMMAKLIFLKVYA